MAEEIYSPGICDVTKALITPFVGENQDARDITALIAASTINQNIDLASIRGTLHVLDATGYLENLPIRGEETIELEFKSHDFGTTRKIKAHIYKVDNVSVSKDGNGVYYTLHWLSKLTFDASLRKIGNSFRDMSGSQIVKDIFQKYYGKLQSVNDEELPEDTRKYSLPPEFKGANQRSLYIQKTKGNMRLIIPRLSPSEAITFVAERSFSDRTPSSSYRFFETLDGYYFVTDEWLQERAMIQNEVKSFSYNMFSTLNPEEARVQTSSIDSFENPRRVNVGSEMMNGYYRNSVMEIDLLRRKVTTYNYSYLQSDAQYVKENKDNIALSEIKKAKQKFITSSGKAPSTATDVHSQQFIEKTFTNENSKRYMIVRDYTQKESGSELSRDETFYRQITAFKNMYENHLNATTVQIGLNGRLDLSAGEIININYREQNPSGDTQPNKQLSGKYLIRKVFNRIDGNVLRTVCDICKYDWTDAGIDVNRVVKA